MCAANEHLTVILVDTSVHHTQTAIEVATRAAERGAMLQRRNGIVEIISMEHLDDEVRKDNRLWNLIQSAHSIVLVGSFNVSGVASTNLRRFLRLSAGEKFHYGTRVAALTATHEGADDCPYHNCHGGSWQLQQWAKKAGLTWTMDANITVTNFLLDRDFEHWREVCTIIGEHVTV